MRIVDQGIISRPPTGGAYMAAITPLPDGSYIACQFVSSTFVSSDARIEVLRSTDGLATWASEGQLRGQAADRQVDGARVGLSINQGLFGHGSSVLVRR